MNYTVNRTTLEFALIGARSEEARILQLLGQEEARISNITDVPKVTLSDPSQQQPKKRKVSAAARKKMADAQKKRWALKKEQEASVSAKKATAKAAKKEKVHHAGV